MKMKNARGKISCNGVCLELDRTNFEAAYGNPNGITVSGHVMLMRVMKRERNKN